MTLTMLGTGNAAATACYNTCFVVTDESRSFLVDGGGGNGLLVQLENAGIDIERISDVFVTHKHIDHILGILWLIRVRKRSASVLRIYSHSEVIELLHRMAEDLAIIAPGCWGNVQLIPVEAGKAYTILGRPVTFFDLLSTKVRQFGFSMNLGNGNRLSCFGDEPCTEHTFPYARGAKWLLHEAFCLDSEKDLYHPHEKHHSTVKDACELAERAGAENLILYHTEDREIFSRQARYTAEGKHFYSGNLFIPYDLEKIELLC